ncbi:MAG: hypothetical protein PVJ57_20115 [Phycisphaerae bacterium]|jgi:hypothetical protein
MKKPLLLSLAAGLAVLAIDARASIDLEYRTVMLTGMQAPGLPAGVTFDSLCTYATINDAGRVAVGGRIVGPGIDETNDLVLWRETPGGFVPIAQTGQAAPGGVLDDWWGYPVINAAGDVAFTAHIEPTPGDSIYSVWTASDIGTTALAYPGMSLPDVEPGATFRGAYSFPAFNNAGQVAFSGELDSPTVGLRGALWLGGSAGLELLMCEGAAVPGGEPDDVFQRFSPPTINGSGQVALWASAAGNDSVWLAGNGGLQLVAAEGQAAPGMPDGTTFHGMGGIGDLIAINDAGKVAFGAVYQPPSGMLGHGIWAGQPEALAPIALTGDVAPGVSADAEFFRPLEPALAANGDVIFRGIATDHVSQISRTGIWRQRADEISLVAVDDTIPPGVDDEALLDAFVQKPLVNDAGSVAFLATLTGENVNETNDRGLWAEGPDGLLRLVLREGDLFEVAPGDFRTVEWLGTLLSAPETGRGIAFNANYELTFAAMFTDGSDGIFVATVPEPSSFAMVFLAVACLHRWRRSP